MQRLSAALWRFLYSWMSARSLLAAVPPVVHKRSKNEVLALFERPGRAFLHVGCGPAHKPDVPPIFQADEWNEIRLDIDPLADPDIVASMLDMSAVPTSAVDSVYSAHNIEHLYPHEVQLALTEFLRVLKPDGLLVLTCPDLQTVCGLVAEGRLLDPIYISPAGPVASLDILFGHRPQLAEGKLFMAHRTGFTLRTLVDTARAAGFRSVAGRRRPAHLDLWMVAAKALLPDEEIGRLADTHLPHE